MWVEKGAKGEVMLLTRSYPHCQHSVGTVEFVSTNGLQQCSEKCYRFQGTFTTPLDLGMGFDQASCPFKLLATMNTGCSFLKFKILYTQTRTQR